MVTADDPTDIPSTGNLWIVTPVYRDVDSFVILRQYLLEAVAAMDALAARQVQFVVVDDTGGRDDSMADLEGLPDVVVVEPPFNLGHQRAIVLAIRMMTPFISDGDFVVTLDSDGEDRPEDLPRLLEPLLAHPHDTKKVVLALRTKREESAVFKVLYRCFRTVFHLLTGVVVRSGNFAAYRGWLAKRLLLHPHFDLCYSSTLTSLDLRVEHVPCERGHRYAGQTRMGYAKLVLHGFRMLLPYGDRLALRALIAGGVLLGTTVTGAAAATVAAVLGVTSPGTGAALVLAVTALLGLWTAMFGFLLFVVFLQSRSSSLAGVEGASRWYGAVPSRRTREGSVFTGGDRA